MPTTEPCPNYKHPDSHVWDTDADGYKRCTLCRSVFLEERWVLSEQEEAIERYRAQRGFSPFFPAGAA